MTPLTRLAALEARCDFLLFLVLILCVLAGALLVLIWVSHTASERRHTDAETLLAALRERERQREQWETWVRQEIGELRRGGDDWWRIGGAPPWEEL